MAEGSENAWLPHGPEVSRRTFLGLTVVGGGAVAAACAPGREPTPSGGGINAPDRPPVPPPTPRPRGVLDFFDRDEADTVEAVAARIFPGDADDPGAREAGAIDYIDGKLATFEEFAEPTFLEGPFARGYEGVPPLTTTEVPIPESELFRYGYQSGRTPQQLYRDGLEGLDRYSTQRFDRRFMELTEDEQDAVLLVLDAVSQRSEDGGTGNVGDAADGGGGQGGGPTAADLDAAEEAFGEVDPGAFFTTLRTDTLEGIFADPLYGGNRDMVGWRMLRYPGPQRAYSPQEMLHGAVRQTQSLHGMHPMNPDRPGPHAPEALEQRRQGVKEG